MTIIAKPACDECLGEKFVFPDDVADWIRCPVCNPGPATCNDGLQVQEALTVDGQVSTEAAIGGMLGEVRRDGA